MAGGKPLTHLGGGGRCSKEAWAQQESTPGDKDVTQDRKSWEEMRTRTLGTLVADQEKGIGLNTAPKAKSEKVSIGWGYGQPGGHFLN